MKELIISQSNFGSKTKCLDRYFNDINKISLLKGSEEVDLAKKIGYGDRAALGRLVSTNLRFVISVARQFQNQGIDIIDLINEGNLGLITAAQRFDETKGFKFISYAVWWIRRAIISAIAEQSHMVHLPFGVITLIGQVKKASQQLENKHLRKPSLEELAELLDLPINKLKSLNAFSYEQISLYAPVSRSAELNQLDIIAISENPTDQGLIDDCLKTTIQNSLGILNSRDQVIIQLYFGLKSLPRTLEDIAQHLNLSVEHTRRRKDNALQKVRDSAYGPLLRAYLK